MTDAQQVNRMIAGDLLDAAARALVFPPTEASLRTARENAEAAIAAIKRCEANLLNRST